MFRWEGKFTKVNLIAYTPEPEKVVACAAKLCYSNADSIDTLMEGLTDEKVGKFIRHLASMSHQSPIEHVSFTFAIEGVSRALLAQLTRHRIGSYCLSGDTVVGYGQKTKGMTIKELAEKATQYQNMIKLRSMDENSKQIISNSIVSVWYAGEKPVYKMTTEDGYTIKATEKHRFLSEKGWVELGALKPGESIYTNGVPAYKNPDWLYEVYHNQGLMQSQIAELCGVTSHTIRKWIAKNNLQKPAGSWSIGKTPHNKGKTKYTYKPTMVVSKKMKGNTNYKSRVYRYGENISSMSGGYAATHRFNEKTGVCEICGEKGVTELHHIDKNPMNWKQENIQELCVSCHKRIHKGVSVKAVKPSIIKSIEYYGVEPTYDIEMAGPHNNFIADGFVVHNSVQSQRYVSMEGFSVVEPPAIWEDDYLSEIFSRGLEAAADTYNDLRDLLIDKYVEEGMDKGAAEKKANEDARYILPNAATTRLILTMNARSLLHFFSLRCCNRAQWEIRELAEKMLKLVYPIAPNLFANAGPGCVSEGRCPEGSMSCGKMAEMQEKYSGLKTS